jgi:hypothetical protein
MGKRGRKSLLTINETQVKTSLRNLTLISYYGISADKIAADLGFKCPPPHVCRAVLKKGFLTEEEKFQYQCYVSAKRQITNILNKAHEVKPSWVGFTGKEKKAQRYRFVTEQEINAYNEKDQLVSRYRTILNTCGLQDYYVGYHGITIPLNDLEHLIPLLSIFGSIKKKENIE